MTTVPGVKLPFGPKPELVWLPVEKLHVDHRYQRSLSAKRSQKLIAAIAQEFNWFLLGTLIVVRGVADYLIIDGQHRSEAAKRRGIVEVPCALFPNVPLAEQAKAFVDANRCRITVSPFAIYHARQLAGDPAARAIADACEEAGVSIPRNPGAAAALKPGETLALGAIRSLIASHGHAVAVRTLTTLREAMPEPGAMRAHYINALGNLVRFRPELSLPKLKAALEQTGFDAMEKLVLTRALETGETRITAAEITFLDLLGMPRLAPSVETAKTLKPGFAARVAPAAGETKIDLVNRRVAPPRPAALSKKVAPVAEPDPGPQPETEADIFTKPLQRRCPCGTVFLTRSAAQVHCEKCSPTTAPAGRAGRAK